MNDIKTPWQTPSVEQLDVSSTLGGGLVNSDNGAQANNAFPNPS